MMGRTVNLTIDSRSDGQRIRQSVSAQAYERNGHWYYRYTEPDNGMGTSTVIVKLESGDVPRIQLLRQGAVRSKLLFEAGAWTEGEYETVHGTFKLGLRTTSLSVNVSGEGSGEWFWSYELIVQGESQGVFRIKMKAEAKSPS